MFTLRISKFVTKLTLIVSNSKFYFKRGFTFEYNCYLGTTKKKKNKLYKVLSNLIKEEDKEVKP